MKKKEKYSDEAILQALYRGTTESDRCTDPKVAVVIRKTERYALVHVKGSSYYSRRHVYVNGHIDLVRLPEDLHTIGGYRIWEVDRKHRITKSRLAAIIAAVDAADLPEDMDEMRSRFHAILTALEPLREVDE